MSMINSEKPFTLNDSNVPQSIVKSYESQVPPRVNVNKYRLLNSRLSEEQKKKLEPTLQKLQTSPRQSMTLSFLPNPSFRNQPEKKRSSTPQDAAKDSQQQTSITSYFSKKEKKDFARGGFVHFKDNPTLQEQTALLNKKIRELLEQRESATEHTLAKQKRGSVDDLVRIRKYLDSLNSKTLAPSRVSNRNQNIPQEYFASPISLSDYLKDSLDRYENRLDPNIETLINSSIEYLTNRPTRRSQSSSPNVDDLMSYLLG